MKGHDRLMLSVLFLVVGLVLLVAGAELLVRGASALATAAGIPPLVVGLTIVAFGTSAPELAVSVGAALNGESDLALGNVVGSNIFNVLFILGLAASIAPLVVAGQLVRIEVPIVIVTSILALILCLDGSIGRIDGALLFGGLLAYLFAQMRMAPRESTAVVHELAMGYDEPAARARPSARVLLGQGALVLVGLALLVVGARLLVEAATEIARALGVSELVIGLTIIAAGTSLPELATSVLATIRGQREIAVGNVVGSNIFNLLGILGLAALIQPIVVAPGALWFDLPVMVAVALVCLPIFFTGGTIARWEGGLLLAAYACYTMYLVLDAAEHAALPTFRAVMLFVLPLTALALVTSVLVALRRPAPIRAGQTAPATESETERR